MLVPTSIQQKTRGSLKVLQKPEEGGFPSIADEYDPQNPNIYDELVKPKGRKEKMVTSPLVVAPRPQIGPGTEGPSVFGFEMLKKMGWHEGKGLGKEQQGMVAPLVTEQKGLKSGVIVQGKAMEFRQMTPGTIPAAPIKTSKCIRLENLVLGLLSESELEDQITEEAAKSGNLVNVSLSKVGDGLHVLCEYETLDDSANAFAHFNGFIHNSSRLAVFYA